MGTQSQQGRLRFSSLLSVLSSQPSQQIASLMEGSAPFSSLHFSSIQFDELPIDDILALIDGSMEVTEAPYTLDRPSSDCTPPVVTSIPQPKSLKGRKPIGLKPKRIRRERREALFLREQAAHLEKTLTALSIKSQKRSRDPPKRDQADAMAMAMESAMWKQIAKRNLNQRIASEIKNKRLKAEVQELVQLANNLEHKAEVKQKRKSPFNLTPKATDRSSEIVPSSCNRVGKKAREILSLREASQGLAHKLESMKQAIRDREQRSIIAEDIDATYSTTSANTKATNQNDDGMERSWASVAARRLLQRTASESEKAGLQEILHEQAEMADQIKQILSKTDTKELLSALEQMPPQPPALGLINLKSQTALLDSLYLETEHVFLASEFAESPTPSFNTVQVTKDCKLGLRVEIRSSHAVDYDLNTTMAAQWQIARDSHANGHFIYEEAKDISEHVLSREFGFQTKLGSRQAHFRGRHTTKKFTSDEGSVYVWHTRVVPLDATSGSSACIFPLVTKGRTSIRPASNSSPSSPSTVIQSCCQIIPELEDITLADLEQHREGINALLAFSKRVTERNTEAIAEMLGAAKKKSKGYLLGDENARRCSDALEE